eukprot:1269721-Pleurochrysis_carterae.AAC.2
MEDPESLRSGELDPRQDRDRRRRQVYARGAAAHVRLPKLGVWSRPMERPQISRLCKTRLGIVLRVEVLSFVLSSSSTRAGAPETMVEHAHFYCVCFSNAWSVHPFSTDLALVYVSKARCFLLERAYGECLCDLLCGRATPQVFGARALRGICVHGLSWVV